MPYQVGTNIAALNVYNNLGVHQAKSADALARVSSGLKAAGGGDVASTGAATAIQVSNMKTQNYISNVQYQLSKLQAADTAFGELLALGQKGIEVGNRASDANADTSAITAQLTALKAGIDSIKGNTQFGGAALEGAGSVTVGSGSATTTVTFGTPAAATADGFKTFVETMVDNRATNAGRIASLQNTLQVLNSVASNELDAMSQIQEADIAKEMMSLTSANILTEAATAMLAQAMQMPNNVLKLLQ